MAQSNTAAVADHDHDARRDSRHRLNLKGSARIALGIDIIDASASGVRARLSVPLPVGTLVKIGLQGQNRHARVVWRDGEVTGCEFLAPLTPAELNILIESAARAGND